MHTLTAGCLHQLHGRPLLCRVTNSQSGVTLSCTSSRAISMSSQGTAAAAVSSAAEASQPAHSGGRRPCVYVYDGDGAGIRCAASAIDSLRQAFRPEVQVRRLHTHALLSGSWEQDCVLLVMPGGADLPYCKHLNGKGNERIRAYVEQGGSYLGLCAGAYYGAGRVEFEEGGGIMKVVGDRELGFWPYPARGAAYAGFDYASERGAVAAPITFQAAVGMHLQHAQSVSQQEMHGSLQQHTACTEVTSTSNTSLQHTHRPRLEYSFLQQEQAPVIDGAGWSTCVDYCNGGPVFVGPLQQVQIHHNEAFQAAADTSSDSNSNGVGTGRESDGQGDAARAPRCGWQYPAAAMLQLPPGCSVLATYDDVGPGAAAAVRCAVGQGVAVLCGTHPELHPSWLSLPEEDITLNPAVGEPPTSATAMQNSSTVRSQKSQDAEAAPALTVVCGGVQDGGSVQNSNDGQTGDTSSAVQQSGDEAEARAQDSKALRQHVAELTAALYASQQSREAFWHMLLAACCVTFPSRTLPTGGRMAGVARCVAPAASTCS